MPASRTAPAGQAARALVAGALFVWACGGVEVFHAGVDGGPPARDGSATSPGGAAPPIGTGGAADTGSGGAPVTTTGGAPVGSGGRGTGGAETGGRGTGGRGTGGRASGGVSTGGRGTGGASATGGRGTGGRASGGASIGGRSSGGATAAGGRSTGGATATGGRGTGGASATGPCGGLCDDPVNVPPRTNSGALGTGATCHQVVGMVAGIVCGNFTAPRTFSVNGATVSCNGGSITVPPLRNGGYCMESTAGQTSSAYFTTY